MSDAVKITVDGVEVECAKGELVIDAAERAGTHIPRFCYHPRMSSVGMCRMCIVDIDTGRGPALQPSCMIPVADGMTVTTDSPGTKKAQDGVLELLLINHPLDCPVCDKGGECPLQDNAYAYGPGESRYVEEKRHYEKPIPLSELVLLDRERCILCDRCTRFAKEVAGDPLIHFINRGGQTEVNTFPDDPFSSYFSGNTVQICPVGALTAKPFRFKARPWDLDKGETTCTSCAVGCRTTIEASRNHVLRTQGVDVDPVNWGWLCDKGRFDFEAIESADRLRTPMLRAGDQLREATWAEALRTAAGAISKAEPTAVAVIGGSRLSNEAAYAWAKLAKGVIGTDHVDAQLGDGLPGDVVVSLPAASIDDVCTAGGTVVVVAGDLKEELPVLFLRLRHAVVNDRVKVVEISAVPSGITGLAAASLRCRPGEAHAVMSALVAGGDAGAVLEGDLAAAQALVAAGPVTAIVGRPSLAESPAAAVEAAAALLEAKPDTRFLPVLRRANARGAVDLGLAPGLLPGRTSLAAGRDWFTANGWAKVPAADGLDTAGILQAAADGRVDVLVLLGADPAVDFPDHDLATRGLAGARTVIAIDTFLTPSSRQADVLLAAAGWGETAGTTTNVEGRVSTLAQRVTPPGTARADWIIAAELAFALGADLGVESEAELLAEVGRLAPAHAGLDASVLKVAGDGVLVPVPADVLAAADGTPVTIGAAEPVPATADAVGAGAAVATDRPAEEAAVASAPTAGPDGTEQPEGEAEPSEPAAPQGPARPAPLAWVRPAAYAVPGRDGYALRLVAARSLYDAGTALQHSPSLAGLSPGSRLRVNPADLQRLGLGAGASVRIGSSRSTATVEAHADPTIPKGTALLHVNQPDGPDPASFVDAGVAATEIRVETA